MTCEIARFGIDRMAASYTLLALVAHSWMASVLRASRSSRIAAVLPSWLDVWLLMILACGWPFGVPLFAIAFRRDVVAWWRRRGRV